MHFHSGPLPFLCLVTVLVLGCSQSGEPVAVLDTEERAGQDAAPDDPFGPVETEKVSDRLEELEESLAEVKIELSRIAPALERVAELEAQLVAASRPAPVQTAAVKAPRAMPSKPTSGGGDVPAMHNAKQYAVHVGSFKNAENVAAGWAAVKAKHPDVLQGLTPVVARVRLESGEFIRLKAGPFSSWGEAGAACKGLAARGTACTVLDYSGETIM